MAGTSVGWYSWDDEICEVSAQPCLHRRVLEESVLVQYCRCNSNVQAIKQWQKADMPRTQLGNSNKLCSKFTFWDVTTVRSHFFKISLRQIITIGHVMYFYSVRKSKALLWKKQIGFRFLTMGVAAFEWFTLKQLLLLFLLLWALRAKQMSTVVVSPGTLSQMIKKLNCVYVATAPWL